jgi:hypothetical protein
VSYRGYSLGREELILMRGTLNEKVAETMNKCALFKPVMPQKIFTDMYQYYHAQQMIISGAPTSLQEGTINDTSLLHSGFL